MYKYQNVSQEALSIVVDGEVDKGTVEPGGIVHSSVAIENPNFKYLGEVQNDTNNVTGTVVTGENQVTDAQPIEGNTNETEVE